MNNDIKKVLEETLYNGTLYKRNKTLPVLDVIEKENLFNSKNKIFMAIGFVDVNSFYYELFLRMSEYCKEHISNKCICYHKNDSHNSIIYLLNTYKYYLIIWGDDLQDKNYSSSNIVIQEK